MVYMLEIVIFIIWYPNKQVIDVYMWYLLFHSYENAMAITLHQEKKVTNEARIVNVFKKVSIIYQIGDLNGVNNNNSMASCKWRAIKHADRRTPWPGWLVLRCSELRAPRTVQTVFSISIIWSASVADVCGRRK